MSKKSLSKLLTEVELEVMNILWSLEGGTVRDVLASLSKERNLAYTSVSTMLRILEQKKIIKSSKEGKAHIYSPILLKHEYEGTTLNHMVNHVFEGAPSNLVKCLVSDKNLSDSEREQIKSILAEL